jgi:primosomal protein N''
MTKKINQQLIDNISIILKKSLSADATLADLRETKKASFDSIFKKEAGFRCTANTFQPYVEEVADDLLQWQQSQTQEILVAVVKKIEQLFTVLGNFEQSIAN